MMNKALGNTILAPITVMAEEPSFRESGTPSPEREDVSLAFGRLRVKPAMTARGDGSEVLR